MGVGRALVARFLFIDGFGVCVGMNAHPTVEGVGWALVAHLLFIDVVDTMRFSNMALTNT